VQIQRLSPVDLGWVTIANVTTNAIGTATFSYGPPYHTQFRAVFAGATDLGPATSSIVPVAVRHRVTLSPGAGIIRVLAAGTRVTYTATVRPIAPAGVQRVTFLIYKRVGGVWTFRTSATVTATGGVGQFSWRWGRGEWYIRARANATVYNLAALSAIARIRAV
jgi:hypothetical protein